MLEEAYGNLALRAQWYNWFEKFKSGDFDVGNKSPSGPPKSLKTLNCKPCWIKKAPKHKKKTF